MDDKDCAANDRSDNSRRRKTVMASQVKNPGKHNAGRASGRNIQLKKYFLSAECFHKRTRRKTELTSVKNKAIQDVPSDDETGSQKGKSTRVLKVKQVKRPSSLDSIPIVKNSSHFNTNTGSRKSYCVTPNITKLQIDELPNFSTASTIQFSSMHMSTIVKERKVRCYSKEKPSPGGSRKSTRVATEIAKLQVDELPNFTTASTIQFGSVKVSASINKKKVRCCSKEKSSPEGDEVFIADVSSANSRKRKSVRANGAENPENHSAGCAFQLKKVCLTSESFKKRTRRKTKRMPAKYKKIQDIPSDDERGSRKGKSTEILKVKPLKRPRPLHGTPIVKDNSCSDLNTGFRKLSLVTPNITKLQIDKLHNFSTASTIPCAPKLTSTPKKQQKTSCYSKDKSSTGGTKNAIPAKGTLKRSQWVRNTLNGKDDGYEDDIFESKDFDPFIAGLTFDDDSDTSSENVATPKRECMLSPVFSKQIPSNEDCISPIEILEARKNAEKYLYRRNKKRMSENKDSVSTSKQSIIKMDPSILSVRRKLDFESALKTLTSLRKDVDKEAEGHGEEDSYFSDASI